MSVVVDSSVLIAALVDTGAPGRWAEQIIDRGTPSAPELLMVEAMNILRRLEAARQITSLEANADSGELMELEVELFPFAPFAGRIWQLRHNLTSYDAWYVALAEALNVPLATLDRRLSRVNGLKCEFLVP